MTSDWWKRYGEAWNSHDPHAVVAFMTEDPAYAGYEDLTLHERHEGRDDIRAWLATVGPTFSPDCADS
jgi:hypothetical protein